MLNLWWLAFLPLPVPLPYIKVIHRSADYDSSHSSAPPGICHSRSLFSSTIFPFTPIASSSVLLRTTVIPHAQGLLLLPVAVFRVAQATLVTNITAALFQCTSATKVTLITTGMYQFSQVTLGKLLRAALSLLTPAASPITSIMLYHTNFNSLRPGHPSIYNTGPSSSSGTDQSAVVVLLIPEEFWLYYSSSCLLQHPYPNAFNLS